MLEPGCAAVFYQTDTRVEERWARQLGGSGGSGGSSGGGSDDDGGSKWNGGIDKGRCKTGAKTGGGDGDGGGGNGDGGGDREGRGYVDKAFWVGVGAELDSGAKALWHKVGTQRLAPRVAQRWAHRREAKV